MQERSNSSLWKSLAVAFGYGAAFGVGMKLSQNASRTRTPTPLVEAPPAPALLESIPSTVEARLADVHAAVSRELQALNQQDKAILQHMSDELRGIREQVISLNREFAEVVGRIVEEQAAHVEARTSAALAACIDPLQQRLNAADAEVEQKLVPLRLDIERKDREIAELRDRAAANEAGVVDLVKGLGAMCSQFAGGAPSAVQPDTEQPAESGPGAANEIKPGALWRMRVVSSVLLTAGAAALRHYL